MWWRAAQSACSREYPCEPCGRAAGVVPRPTPAGDCTGWATATRSAPEARYRSWVPAPSRRPQSSLEVGSSRHELPSGDECPRISRALRWAVGWWGGAGSLSTSAVPEDGRGSLGGRDDHRSPAGGHKETSAKLQRLRGRVGPTRTYGAG